VLAHRVNGKLTELKIKTREDSFFQQPGFTATVKTSKDQKGVCTFRNPKKLYQKNVEGYCAKQMRIKGKDNYSLMKPSDENLDVKQAITYDRWVKNKNENKFVFDLYQNCFNPSSGGFEAYYVRPAEKSKENQKVKTSEEKAADDLNQYELFKKDIEGSFIRRKGALFLKPFDENLPTARSQKAVKNEVENKFVFDIYQNLDRSKFKAKNVRPAKKE